MNCSTDYNFLLWDGLPSYSLPEWCPMPPEPPTPLPTSNFFQTLPSETIDSAPQKLSEKKITKGARGIQSSEKTSQCSKKHFWAPQEDEKLKEGVKKYGLTAWKQIAIGLFSDERTPKQCKERYENYLDPGLCHTPFTAQEIRKLLEIVNSTPKNERGAFCRLTINDRFNKDLKAGQRRSADLLKSLHKRLMEFHRKNTISSSVSTVYKQSFMEIDINAFIRNCKRTPVKKKKGPTDKLSAISTQHVPADTLPIMTHWSEKEDKTLIQAVEKHGKKWNKFYNLGLLKRAPHQMSNRWNRYLDPSIITSPKRKLASKEVTQGPAKKQEISSVTAYLR